MNEKSFTLNFNVIIEISEFKVAFFDFSFNSEKN